MYGQTIELREVDCYSGQKMEFPRNSVSILNLSSHEALFHEGDKAHYIYEILEG